MSSVVIHRCVLRIRRTAGWTWGASPDALLATATRALPRLITARLPALAERLPGSVHVMTPVRIRVATTVRELSSIAEGATPASSALQDRIEAAVAAEIARSDVVVARADIPRSAGAHASEPPREPELPALDDAAAPWLALRVWWRSGAIEQVLSRLDTRAIAYLEERTLVATPARTPRADLVAIAHEAATRLALDLDAPGGCARLRLALAAAIAETSPTSVPADIAAAAAAVAGAHLDVRIPDADHEEPAAPAASPAPLDHAPAATSRRASGVIEIRSVLPFLLLPALHHAGWLASARALLAAHEAGDVAFVLAAGLAAKVLDPLDRGWSRSRADRVAIAAFTGRDEPIDDGELARASLQLAPALSALDIGLRALLARARRPRPLVLCHEPRGWILFDADGMVALACGGDLGVVLAAAPRAPLLVAAHDADPAVLDRIDLANHRFVTDAPVGRGEAWRTFAGASGRLVTNDTETPSAQLAAQTVGLSGQFALADELVEQLALRPALARASFDPLEVSCTLAATAALADLGGRLFPTEQTTPVLALTRFRDLDACVAFDDDCIRVRVPLGRRHADLMHHGILREIANVPWLGGRTVDLGGA